MTSASCIFCDIYHKQKEPLLYKDDKVFAFHDISKASFTQHVLVCPIQHTESALDIKDTTLITHMKKVGEDVLRGFNKGEQFRFGFHLGFAISVKHTHLHCFVLPYSSWIRGNLMYGFLLNSVEDVIAKIQSKKK